MSEQQLRHCANCAPNGIATKLRLLAGPCDECVIHAHREAGQKMAQNAAEKINREFSRMFWNGCNQLPQ